MRRWIAIAVIAMTAATVSSCAYYNTYYMANKYYMRATGGLPYPVEGNNASNNQNYSHSIDYAKKLIANYPKSKWVDDAWLLWARALLGRDDPLQTVNMLQNFDDHFPKSPLEDDATFYLGVGQRAARHNSEALVSFDQFLKNAPKDKLAPYAHYERARVLMALQRPADAADAAGMIVDKFPKSALVPRARTLRAQARFAAGQYNDARADYHYMGSRARTDDERLDLLMSEADCLEADRQYDQELALLAGALSHVPAPVHGDTTGGKIYTAPTGPKADHFGRLTLRVGSVQLLQGRLPEALTAYNRVVDDYPRTALAAEAQYRIGYAYETVGDDFTSARGAYAKVKDQGSSAAFTAQAASRLANLDKLAKFRATSGDSTSKRAEANFLLAEQYLFQLDKPDRAIETYGHVVDSLKGTPWAGKALNAQAWVLSRKLHRDAAAESLLWKVVHEYPGTEAQLAARDYLEAAGRVVPADLIVMPAKPVVTVADTAQIAPPPATPPLGTGGAQQGLFAPADSSALHHAGQSMFSRPGTPPFGRTPADSPAPHFPAPRDTSAPHPAPRDTSK